MPVAFFSMINAMLFAQVAYIGRLCMQPIAYYPVWFYYFPRLLRNEADKYCSGAFNKLLYTKQVRTLANGTSLTRTMLSAHVILVNPYCVDSQYLLFLL